MLFDGFLAETNKFSNLENASSCSCIKLNKFKKVIRMSWCSTKVQNSHFSASDARGERGTLNFSWASTHLNFFWTSLTLYSSDLEYGSTWIYHLNSLKWRIMTSCHSRFLSKFLFGVHDNACVKKLHHNQSLMPEYLSMFSETCLAMTEYKMIGWVSWRMLGYETNSLHWNEWKPQ